MQQIRANLMTNLLTLNAARLPLLPSLGTATSLGTIDVVFILSEEVGGEEGDESSDL
jgi:hypothetical protein